MSGDTPASDTPAETEIDALWKNFARGDARAQDKLLALFYDELRRIARRVLHGDGGAVLFQPTELANEAALRILKLDRISYNDRQHFLSTAVRVMRQVLLDEIRRAKAAKRQAPVLETRWPEFESMGPAVDIENLDAALTELAAISPERAQIVELRFYAGLTVEEIARAAGISDSTVKRHWRTARAWLLEKLEAER